MPLPDISLAQFNRIATGDYNAGQIDFKTKDDGSTELVKGNVGFSNGVLTIPHWCAFFLRRLVKDRANSGAQGR